MNSVLSLQERIDRSKRAKAVERAWRVAKTLEGNRDQVEGLTWVEPQTVEGRGITRRIDFSAEFPEDVQYVMPVPMNISVVAPAEKMVPGEDLKVNWTMPLLTRTSKFEDSLDANVRTAMGFDAMPNIRNRIEAVSFLPFPKEGAPAEERFNPEFMVVIELDADLGDPANYFAAVAKYSGKVIKQMVIEGYPKFLGVYADPKTNTHFRAERLLGLSAAELVATPSNAGELEIYIHRIKKGGFSKYLDYDKLADIIPYQDNRELTNRLGGDSFGLDSFNIPTRGGDLFAEYGGLRPLPSITKTPEISPERAAKKIGDVRLGEGIRGEEVTYRTLNDYVVDSGFGVQPIRIRFQGVFEGSEEESLATLRGMAQRY
ncbi:hypothetical protein J4216_00020 [Candidatus Woesearchaeota archaeon]|nr:hypothetical protein [Candidatus Woesearchaeota archaeon]